MKFKDIASRLTGLTCPVFGVSWVPTESDRTIASRVVTFLEDRRVLYAPEEIEVPAHCVRSVLEIRTYLTTELQRSGEKGSLAPRLRALRAASRKFLDEVGGSDQDIVRYGGHQGHWASWRFGSAVGELRGVFGIHLLQLAVEYGLDVEEPLAGIFPIADSGALEEPRKLRDC